MGVSLRELSVENQMFESLIENFCTETENLFSKYLEISLVVHRVTLLEEEFILLTLAMTSYLTCVPGSKPKTSGLLCNSSHLFYWVLQSVQLILNVTKTELISSSAAN